MNLEDVVDPEYGLQQDEWSSTIPTFGKDNQLTVVGRSRRDKSSGVKFYILKCDKCSQDTELFGEGYFSSRKGDLVKGAIPCGCSGSPRWTGEQYSVICSRKANELDYKFLGFVGEWKAQNTKIKMSCDKHGEWNSGTIASLISMGAGCPGCKSESISKFHKKSDDVMIQSFLDTGAFHPNTKFWRSDRKDSRGVKVYWFMSCPECGKAGESFSGDLQQGKRPCACNMHRQQKAYVNWVVDICNNAVAIKFGITSNSDRRIKEQDSKSAYTLKQHSIYQFPDVASCKQAERECKRELECGVLNKTEMLDGYTETTWCHNLDKIISIYIKYGGVICSQIHQNCN